MTARISAVIALCLGVARAATSQSIATPARFEATAGPSAWHVGSRFVWGGATGLAIRLPGEFSQVSLQLQAAFVPSAADGTHPGLRAAGLELALSPAAPRRRGFAPGLVFAVATGRAYFAYVPPPESPPVNCPPATGCPAPPPERGLWCWLLMPSLSVVLPMGTRLGLVPSARLMIPLAEPNGGTTRLRLDMGVRWPL